MLKKVAKSEVLSSEWLCGKLDLKAHRPFPLWPLQKASLENSLREVETRYTMQMEQLNGILLHLESELAQARAEGQRQTQEYETLLNIKVKLESEIATYRRLLEEGEDFR